MRRNDFESRYCFNALNGLLPFLLEAREKGNNHGLLGFNALNGLLPFLQSSPSGNYLTLILFQRPKRASSISTMSYLQNNPEDFCFNALNGLLPFLLGKV